MGGMTLTVQIPAGADIQAAYDAAWNQLVQMAAKQFESVLNDYQERVRQAGERMRG
jgi:hypothetical protein